MKKLEDKETEQRIMRACMVRLSELGCRVWRNNVALAWVGKTTRVSRPTKVEMYPGDVLIRQARPLHAGLCAGSSDLIGIQPIIVTDNMIGQKFGRFLAPEIKTEMGIVDPQQNRFCQSVQEMGGNAGIIRSVEDAERMVAV